MPLVNAEEHEYDADHYATVSNGVEGGGLLGHNFNCTMPKASETDTMNVYCESDMAVDLSKADGARTQGYWYGVAIDMPKSSDVNLEQSTLTTGGKTYKLTKGEGGALENDDTRKWIGAWNKVDESLIGSDKKVLANTYVFTFADTTTMKTYTQTINVYLDYSRVNFELKNEDPEESGLYTIEVAAYLDGKMGTPEIVYVPITKKDTTLDKVTELNKYLTKAGYVFKGVGETEDFKAVPSSFLNLSTVKLDGNKKLVVVFEKDPDYVAPSNPSDTTKPADKDKDATPKTGNTDLMGFVPLMTLLSLVGIVTLKKTI